MRAAGQQVQRSGLTACAAMLLISAVTLYSQSSSALSRDGKFLLVLHAAETPRSIAIIETASLKETARVPVPDAWLGLTFSPDGRFVYVGGAARNSVLEFSWSPTGELKPTREMAVAQNAQIAPADFIGDVAVSPDGRLIYAADLFHDAILVINPQSGRVIERYRTGRRPYRILFHPDGKSYFVSSWAEGAVYQHETATGTEMGRIRLGPQTTDMVLSDRRIPGEQTPWRYRLFVTAANTNNVFVVGVTESKPMSTLEVLNIGMVPAQPAGMTPSALALSADQTRLYVVCSDANVVAALDVSETRSRVGGFVPVSEYPLSARALPDGRLLAWNGRAAATVIPALEEESLAAYTRTAMTLSPYRATMADEQPAARSLFEHVVYVITDGLGADQPNSSRLAREFVRFDNYRALGETSAAGHLWAMAGIAPSFTRRLGSRLPDNRPAEIANQPPAGYLWSNARIAGLTVRNYGEFVQGERVMDSSLTGITNLKYTGSGVERARVFLDDLKQFEASGAMPRLTILRLGKEDDQALGLIVEGISKSRFWPRTAIFVAGASPEGRSLLLAISPYTRRGSTNTTSYNQTSVLRTIELILELRPMTMFDAAARSLTDAFVTTPNPAPYTAESPRP